MLDQEEHGRGGIGASGGDLKMYWAKCGLPGSAGPGDQLPAAPGKAQLSVLGIGDSGYPFHHQIMSQYAPGWSCALCMLRPGTRSSYEEH